MLVQPLYDVGGVKQPFGAQDILNTREQTYAIVNAGGFSLIGSDLTRGELIISGNAGAAAIVLPTADDLVKQLVGSLQIGPSSASFSSSLNTAFVGELAVNMQPLPPASSFRRTIINNNGGTITLSAPSNAGMSISGTATIATVNWREYIIRIENASALQIIPVSTTNASKVLSNVDGALIRSIRPGMSVYGTGIGASAKVAAVNVDARTITTDVNSTATADNIAVTFTPTVVVQTLRGGNINN